MKLSNVLAQIGTEKTAGATATATAPKVNEKAAATGSEERLKAALAEAMSPSETAEKQASTPSTSPVSEVKKIASEVLGAEKEALVKEAELYGAAVCDGFMQRMAQYDAAAEKVAAAQPVLGYATATLKTAGADTFEKFAGENPELVKEAAELGYARTMDQMNKLAEAAYSKGHEEGVAMVYKTAHQTFLNGFEDAALLVQELRS